MKDLLEIIGSAQETVGLRMAGFLRNHEIDSVTDQDLEFLKYLPEGFPVRAEIIAEMVWKREIIKEKEFQCGR